MNNWMYHKGVGITVVIQSFLFQYIFLGHSPHASMQREGGNKLFPFLFFSFVLFFVFFFVFVFLFFWMFVSIVWTV